MKKIILFYFIFYFAGVEAQVASPLFKEVPYSVLSEDDKEILISLQSSTHIKSFHVITMNDIAKFVENKSQLTFTIPSVENRTFTSSKVEYNYKKLNDFVWTGKMLEKGKIIGDMGIVCTELGFSGFFIYEGSYQQIYPVNEMYSVIAEIDRSKIEGSCGSNSTPEEKDEPATYCEDGNGNCSGTIDVLCIVTGNAYHYLKSKNSKNTYVIPFGPGNLPIPTSNFDPLFQSAAAATNLAFANSKINGKKVRVRTINDFNFNLNPKNKNEKDAFDQIRKGLNIDSLGLYYRADLVCIVSKGGLGPNYAGYANGAYFILTIESFNNFLFAHELGHTLDAQHEDLKLSQGSSCPDAHAFGGSPAQAGATGFTTIMWHTPAYQILNYSNPEVPWAVDPIILTGSKNANNARIINITGCLIAEFRNPPDWKISIASGGVKSLCEDNPSFTLYANTFVSPLMPGQGPYFYSWEACAKSDFSADIVVLGAGTTDNITIYPPPPFCASDIKNFYVRVTITASKGESLSSKPIYIKASNCDCPTIGNKSSNIFSIYPNPSRGQFTFNIESEETKTLAFQVLNTAGRIIKEVEYPLQEGSNELYLDFEDLDSGLYFLQFRIKDELFVEKISITKI